MAQIKTGIRKILENPKIFSAFQDLLGSKRARDIVIDKYLQLEDGMRVLDIGCGPADILHHIKKDIHYTGFDFEKSYIETAKKQFTKNTEFHCCDVSDYKFNDNEKFDRILMFAIQHHLEDSQIEHIFSRIQNLLTPNGKIICVENVYIDNQNPFAKFLISKDRGQNVRTADGYLNLGKKFFSNFKFTIEHNLLRIPYTHIVMTYTNV